MFILKTIVHFTTSKISKMINSKYVGQQKINTFTKGFTLL